MLNLEGTVGYVVRLVADGNEEMLDDLEGEAWVKALSLDLDEIAEMENPRAYVIECVKNHLLDYLRDEERALKTTTRDTSTRATREYVGADRGERVGTTDDDVDEACTDEIDRKIIAMKKAGLTQDQISTRLMVDQSTVQRKLARIAKKLA